MRRTRLPAGTLVVRTTISSTAPTTAAAGPHRHPSAMRRIADHLRARRRAILDAWRARASADPVTDRLAELTREEFEDDIPGTLDALEDRLADDRAGNDRRAFPERVSSSRHAAERWRQGVRLTGLTRDWRHLHVVLLAELEAFERETGSSGGGGLPPEAARQARAELAELIFDGIDQGAGAYDRLYRTEAAAGRAALADTVRSQAAAAGERGEQLREAAHDLRGGLGVVQTAVQVIEAPETDDATREAMLAAVRDAAGDVSRMVEDLLSVGRLESGVELAAPADFDLGALLTALAASLRPAAVAAGARVSAGGPRTLPARTDPVMVRRCVQNLVLNALKYGGDGAAVRVAWAAAPEVFAEPGGRGERDGWRVEVSDDGPGLPPALAAAFDAPPPPAEGGVPPQDREPAAGGGEGVGLSIVRRLVDRLGGTVDCRTGPGGTTFTLHLPELAGDGGD